MIQTFTPHHLILAAYGELPAADARMLHEDLLFSNDDAQAFQNILDVQEILDGLELKPSRTSIEIILNYSKRKGSQ